MKKAYAVLEQGIKIGLIGGVSAVLLALIGMVEAFSQRDIISNVISMGHTLLLLVPVFMGYLAAKRTVGTRPLRILANSLVCGLVVGAFLACLVLLGHVVNLRKVFVNALPTLYQLLTFNQELGTGILILLGAGVLSGVFAGVLYLLPGLTRRILIISLSSIVGVGVLQDMLRPTIGLWGPVAVINEWLGHSGIAITTSAYAAVVPELLTDVADAMDRALGGAS